jgi:hypothetical protein
MRIFFLILFLFFNNLAFSQGAIDGYMKSKNETDIALTYSYEKFNTYFFGDKPLRQSLTTQSASLFVAHGFNKNFNLIASIPYMHIDEENKNLQDAILAIKFRTKEQRFEHGSLSRISSIGFTFPISNYSIETENPIGQRAVAFMLRHLYQYQANSGFFAMAQTGFDFRLIPETQFAIPLIFRTGYAHSKFYFDLWLEYFHTMETGVDQSISAGTGSRFLKIGGTFYYPIIPQLGVFIGGAQFLTGKNIGQATRVNVGVVLRL